MRSVCRKAGNDQNSVNVDLDSREFWGWKHFKGLLFALSLKRSISDYVNNVKSCMGGSGEKAGHALQVLKCIICFG